MTTTHHKINFIRDFCTHSLTNCYFFSSDNSVYLNIKLLFHVIIDSYCSFLYATNMLSIRIIAKYLPSPPFSCGYAYFKIICFTTATAIHSAKDKLSRNQCCNGTDNSNWSVISCFKYKFIIGLTPQCTDIWDIYHSRCWLNLASSCHGN